MVYRFLLTRRWVGLLLVALCVATACVFLGRWQIHRLEYKMSRNHLVSGNAHAQPVPPSRFIEVNRGPDDAHQWRRVRASGHYDAAHTLLVRNRNLQGANGYDVLVPLVTDAGPALLVNRGWVAVDESVAGGVPKRIPASPPGHVTVLALLRQSELASTTGTPPAGQVNRIDVSTIRKGLPYPVYGGYAQLTRERPRPAHSPVLLPLPELTEGLHIAYAVQWFLFALMALGYFGLLARREARDRQAVAEGRAPVVAVRVSG
jgi:cytochrome oxidase assembly protein ShyY1